MLAIIHTNVSLAHQVRAAEAFVEGFKALGFDAILTSKKRCRADIHVVLGPWWALRENIGQSLLMLDRGYWGDPDSFSLHFVDGTGRKVRTPPRVDRPHPDLQSMRKEQKRAIILCDYDQDGSYELERFKGVYEEIEVRPHPAHRADDRPLADVLANYDVAIGRKTTALVDAAIMGLHIECIGVDSPLYSLKSQTRAQWIKWLAADNWHIDEIRTGEALRYKLCLSEN